MPKFFGEKKLKLAFEYGMMIANTAHEMEYEITPELMERAEVMLMGEFSSQTAEQLAIDMGPNILSAFELDITK